MSRHILCEDVGYSIHTSMLTQNSSENRQSERWKSDCWSVFPGTWEPNSCLTFLAYQVTAGWFRCTDCLLHISFLAEGNDERGARNISANASQSCFQSTAGLQVAYLAWQGLSSSSIPDAGSYHDMKMDGWNGKGKVLDNLFSEVSKSKNCNSCWLSCHVSDPSLVTKGKLSAIFREFSASIETVEWRTEAEFLFFGVVLGHATEQQWETAWESLFAYAGYPTVVKWNRKYTVMMIVECQIHATWCAWLMEYDPCDWVTHEHHFQQLFAPLFSNI
jgi:hypothetical protein